MPKNDSINYDFSKQLIFRTNESFVPNMYRVNYKVVSHLFRLYYSQLFCNFYNSLYLLSYIMFSLQNCDLKLMIALQLFYIIPFATKCKLVRKICIFSIMKINVDTFFSLYICPTLDDIFVASKLK